jgi:hypothetical protein
MTTEKLFEKATRNKLRFPTSKGMITVEDLWDLSLTSLDTMARAINKRLKDESDESFINKKVSSNAELELSLEILKYIISVKLKEQDDRKLKAERMEELKMLQDLLTNKKSEELKSLSKEDIEKRINELSA